MANSTTPVISIIIPMYNGGEKIKPCLSHLDQQSFRKEYEVLIIDDASPDHSADTVEQAISRLSHPTRFRLIRCEHNGRAGRARNIGIQEAKGDYIVFIDQDDYPDSKLLETLYGLSENGRYDCTACDVVDKDGAEYHRYSCGRLNTLSVEDRIRIMNQFGYVFAILIRRKIILENSLFFPEKVMFEDVLYNNGLFSCIQSIHTTDQTLYYRCDDENSQTAFLSLEKFKDRVRATEIYLNHFEKLVHNTSLLSNIKERGFYYIYLSCVWWMLNDLHLYNKAFWRTCDEKGHNLQIKWSNVFKSQKDFGLLRLHIMRIIYYCPVVGYLVLVKTICKSVLRKLKHLIIRDT